MPVEKSQYDISLNFTQRKKYLWCELPQVTLMGGWIVDPIRARFTVDFAALVPMLPVTGQVDVLLEAVTLENGLANILAAVIAKTEITTE